eukprot:GILK01011743.1.p1 GENE.GILK01011743.1~~GILK01011743.1.p1  ORF type:complete len:1424 (-),score=261.13 GILK01011743.1:144-4415(-)
MASQSTWVSKRFHSREAVRANRNDATAVWDPEQKFFIDFHDAKFSSEEVLVNPDVFPTLKEGMILEICWPEQRSGRLFVQVRSVSPVQGIKQISILKSIADLYRFPPPPARTAVTCHVAQPEVVGVDFLELSFKDQYISRRDMFRFKTALSNSGIYHKKEVSYLSLRAQVREMLVNGQPLSTGLVTNNTKFIFRSRSARIYWLVQLSREMWEFAEDGELYFDRIIRLMKVLFDKWNALGANHYLSIIFFSRVFHEPTSDSINPFECQGQLGDGRSYQDFFQLVYESKDELKTKDSSPEAKTLAILLKVKKAFNGFPQRIGWTVGQTIGSGSIPSCATEGNVLEAINLSMDVFKQHYLDRDLTHTGQSIVLMTAGAGVFEVDPGLTQLTKARMQDNGIGSDIICVTRPPLHAVPLLVSKVVDGDDSMSPSVSPSAASTVSSTVSVEYHVPHWLHVSYFYSLEHYQGKELYEKIPKMNKLCFASNSYEPLPVSGHIETVRPDHRTLPPNIANPTMANGPTSRLTGITAVLTEISMEESGKPQKNFDDYDHYVFYNRRPLAAEPFSTGRNKSLRGYNSLSAMRPSQSTPFLNQLSAGMPATDAPSTIASTFRVDRQSWDHGSVYMSPSRHGSIDGSVQSRRGSVALSEHLEDSSSRNRSRSALIEEESTFESSRRSPSTVVKDKQLSVEALSSSLPNQSNYLNMESPPEASEHGMMYEPALQLTIEPTTLGMRSSASLHSLQTAISKTVAPQLPFQQRLKPLKSKKMSRSSSLVSFLLESNIATRHSSVTVTTRQWKPSKGSAAMNPFASQSIRDDSITNSRRRWAHLFPRMSVPPVDMFQPNWKSLTEPAILPLTTDYMPKDLAVGKTVPHHHSHSSSANIRGSFAAVSNQNGDKENEAVAVNGQVNGDGLVTSSSGNNLQYLDRGSNAPLSRESRTVETEKSYMQYAYTLSLFPDENGYQNRTDQFVEELICQRLAQDFQLILSEEGTLLLSDLTKYVKNKVLLSKGHEYHQLLLDSDNQNIQITRFIRKKQNRCPTSVAYSYLLLDSQYSDRFVAVKTSFVGGDKGVYPWNYLDGVISGYDSVLTNELRYRRIRFIVVPAANSTASSSLSQFSPVINHTSPHPVSTLVLSATAGSNGSSAGSTLNQETPGSIEPRRSFDINHHAASRVDSKSDSSEENRIEKSVSLFLRFKDLLQSQLGKLNKDLDRSATGSIDVTVEPWTPRPDEEEPRRCETRTIRIPVEQTKSDRFEWIQLQYDATYKPDTCYHVEVQWLVCNGAAVDEIVQMLQRRAKQCGLSMIQVPARNPLGTLDPFHPTLLFPTASEYVKSSVKQLLIEPPFSFVFERKDKFGTQYMHPQGLAFVRIAADGIHWIHNIIPSDDPLPRGSQSACVALFERLKRYVEVAEEMSGWVQSFIHTLPLPNS